ncbi:MAG: sodium:proton antiporter [Methanobacterium sp.]|nr:sodium:proton antiporter [Methanobacterium sp.]
MASEEIFIGLALIIGLGISLQWLARLLKIPGIILLLPAGMIVGPVLGLVKPDEIFGNALFPLVTVGVGILLLKGGLELRLKHLKPVISKSVSRLVIFGVIITLAVGTGAALLLFGVSLQFAFILSALLVVSGPTVVGPILNFARPKEPIGSVLLWEGIIIDPVGAALAVAAISIITAQNPNPLLDLFLTIIVGVIIGFTASFIYNAMDRLRYIPNGLNAIIALMLGIVAIAVGEVIFSEAGLFAALIMGFALANRGLSPYGSIKILTDQLEPLIIGILFIMLAALVNLSALYQYLLPALGLAAILILVQRPLVSLLSTQGLGYSRAEKIFIGALHPRGIVAAATASLFAINLSKIGLGFPQMVPTVFIVILSTVVIYGLGTPILSRLLKIAEPEPKGIAIYGEQRWALDLALSLHKAGATVMLLAPGREKDIQNLPDSENIPYKVYTGSLDELADDEIVDDDHAFIKKIEWLIVASSHTDVIKYTVHVFMESIGLTHMIAFGSEHKLQDQLVFGGKIDILAKTPYGLFGRNQTELLEILDNGGSFKAITSEEQPKEGGTPTGTKPFLRVNKDGSLAVPGNDSPLEDGEYLIVITKRIQ